MQVTFVKQILLNAITIVPRWIIECITFYCKYCILFLQPFTPIVYDEHWLKKSSLFSRVYIYVPIRLACSHFREGNFTNPVNVFTCIMFHNMIADFRPPKTQGVSHIHWWIESDKYLRERDKNANRPTISKRMQSFPTMGSKLLSNTLSFYRQRQKYIWLDTCIY